MKVRGPLITLAAVAALGAGILIVNVSKETEPASGKPVAAAATTPAPATSPPAPKPPAFPAKADYIGKIPTARGALTVEITVEGDKAVAYACDGNTVESWLRGPAVDGAVNLVSKDATSRLAGRLDGDAVVGTLSIGQKTWDFSASISQPPAGLYVYQDAGVRGTWIVDSAGAVTGVMRLSDGSTVPAPGLETDQTSVIDGRAVTATRVQGSSDV